MRQATKKELGKHTKAFDRELGHSEGQYWCDCLTRGYRHYLGMKMFGSEDIEEETLHYLESKVQSSRGATGAMRAAAEQQPGGTIETHGDEGRERSSWERGLTK